ncbi:MAG TPA: CBS domain-containing protein [Methanomassiliicoccales archaeon]|nr:CBS domain-containing protein [Methanomassiliicoccales archaeon]
MFPLPSKIKQMRLGIDMTQAELATKSGVSQSTVTKIERGTIHGSYEAVSSIFRVLQEEMDKHRAGRRVKEVATMDVISVQVSDNLRRASEIMRERGFSQLPVFDGKMHVGSVSERGVLRLLREGISMAELGERSVESSMEESFPIVSEETLLETITPLISHSGAVLVADRGNIIGIVTSSDVLRLI